MRRFLLTAINAKYIHTNLSVRYLKKYSAKAIENIEFCEFSINDTSENILAALVKSNCNVFCFSCYIWNIEFVKKLCDDLKKIVADCIIILGGPEVTYDSVEIMKNNSNIDFIIKGEGEETFLALANAIDKNFDFSKIAEISGITYRNGNNVFENADRALICDLDTIPFPYEANSLPQNKIIYYETTRGCPFNCQFCLSSTIAGVRYFSLDRVKNDISFFVKNGVKQVKLVDRTFNCNKKHSLEIMKYIIELNPSANFHFELAADLIDDDFIEVVGKAPKGLFQFEIGVQSTNISTLNEIKRKNDLNRIFDSVKKLLAVGNANIHLDLIAGLPFEDFKSFAVSFDDVYNIKPDVLQLGFLKLLSGSGIQKKAEEYEIMYHNYAPYEVISTKWISFAELLLLKDVEHLLELYHNSGRFKNSLDYIINTYFASPFDFYSKFSDYWRNNNYYSFPRNMNDLYRVLYEFIDTSMSVTTYLNELIKLDWLLYYNNGNMPDVIRRFNHGEVKEKIRLFIKYQLKTDAKNIYYEVFYCDIIRKSDIPCDTVVFFKKPNTSSIGIDFPYIVKLENIILSYTL